MRYQRKTSFAFLIILANLSSVSKHSDKDSCQNLFFSSGAIDVCSSQNIDPKVVHFFSLRHNAIFFQLVEAN